MENFMPRIF